MDNQRLVVWAAFGLLAFMTYQTWLQDHRPVPTKTTTSSQPAATPASPAADSLPSLVADTVDTPVLQPDGEADATEAGRAPSAGQVIRVSTDVLDVEISTAGGRILSARLRKYPIHKDRPEEPVALLSTEQNNFGYIQSGLIGEAGDSEPYFDAVQQATSTRYELNGDDVLVVPLTWNNGAGISVEKAFTFTRGSYRIDVDHKIRNESDAAWRAAQYTVFRARSVAHERSMFDVDTYSFDGPIVYNGAKSEKLKRDELIATPFATTANNGWIAAIKHHFLRAIIPPADTEYQYAATDKNGIATLSAFGPPTTVDAGTEQDLTTTLFIGPKLQGPLEKIAPSLKLTVDYGILTLLSNPLFWLLSKVFSFVGNWGAAIILVTIIIKSAFYKLTEKSGRSMAKMREIQPRMKALQERYKDDRQALSQAMMELYKREKVNPAAGCLPILIQMPFFLAFYWVLLESVEMRQAPFALWITDLSSRDPYFILPVIMGAAMLFQQKLNPQMGDPMQAKIMQVMPVIFTGFFAFFPSGLVLYWVTNTVLSIAQQWYVNKVVAEESKPHKNKKKGE